MSNAIGLISRKLMVSLGTIGTERYPGLKSKYVLQNKNLHLGCVGNFLDESD